VRRPADRRRRLAALEARAAALRAVTRHIAWGRFFTPDQLAAVLEMVEAMETGALDEAEAVARLAACPGMLDAVDAAYDELESRR